VKRRPPADARKSLKARAAPFQEEYDALLVRLVAAREQANLTQREVSTMMERSHSFISKCESGERSIDVMELLHLARIYKKPVSHFLS
jgi:transcriptional regulator with XRE-family HTH domain